MTSVIILNTVLDLKIPSLLHVGPMHLHNAVFTQLKHFDSIEAARTYIYQDGETIEPCVMRTIQSGELLCPFDKNQIITTDRFLDGHVRFKSITLKPNILDEVITDETYDNLFDLHYRYTGKPYPMTKDDLFYAAKISTCDTTSQSRKQFATQILAHFKTFMFDEYSYANDYKLAINSLLDALSNANSVCQKLFAVDKELYCREIKTTNPISLQRLASQLIANNTKTQDIDQLHMPNRLKTFVRSDMYFRDLCQLSRDERHQALWQYNAVSTSYKNMLEHRARLRMLYLLDST